MASNYYHKEIDGLRAISVLVIILFHLKVALFMGGFIGVDIFFVVSGYLITKIIVANLQAGDFSFREFYIRRTTRILPALIVTLLIALPLAMYLLQPAALVHTAQEMIYALFSLSNFFFWTEASYWAADAERYVLLHTWSLGVEEQFYLVYPLLLVACYRLAGMKGVAVLLAALVIGGTIASEVVLKTDRSAAFYFTPLRFYEFAVGGLAAVLPRLDLLRRSSLVAGVVTVLGIILIVHATITFNRFFPLPGVTILLPLLGAVLILLAGPSPSARLLLMNPLMSWLGKISYSLYLTHWPILVFYRYYFGSELSALEQFGLFLGILASGWLLNRTVEQRFRLSHGGVATADGLSSRTVLLGILLAIIAITATSSALIFSKGWPSRMPEGAQALMDIKPLADTRLRKKYMKENCMPRGEFFCGERQPGQTNIILLADSRALDIYMALRAAYPRAAIQTAWAMGCPPVFDPDMGQSIFYPACPQLNQARLQIALDAPPEDVIFLAQDLTKWRSEAVLETVSRLREAGKTVYLLGQFQFIETRSPIDISIDNLRFDPVGKKLEKYLIKEPFGLDGEYADKIRALGAVYISNREFFYDGEYHFTNRNTGKLLSFDGKHLNKYGAYQFGLFLQEKYPLP